MAIKDVQAIAIKAWLDAAELNGGALRSRR